MASWETGRQRMMGKFHSDFEEGLLKVIAEGKHICDEILKILQKQTEREREREKERESSHMTVNTSKYRRTQ